MTVEPSQNLNLLTSRQAASILRIKQQFIETLIAAGADVNAINQAGFTPLMCAAEKSDLNLVTYLLRAEASINKTDKTGRNALVLNFPRWHHLPHSAQQQQVGLLLFAAGETTADTTTTNGSPPGSTKLHYLAAGLSEKDFGIRLLPLCQRNHQETLASSGSAHVSVHPGS